MEQYNKALENAVRYYTDKHDAWDCGRCPMEDKCTIPSEFFDDGLEDMEATTNACTAEIMRGFQEGLITI